MAPALIFHAHANLFYSRMYKSLAHNDTTWSKIHKERKWPPSFYWERTAYILPLTSWGKYYSVVSSPKLASPAVRYQIWVPNYCIGKREWFGYFFRLKRVRLGSELLVAITRGLIRTAGYVPHIHSSHILVSTSSFPHPRCMYPSIPGRGSSFSHGPPGNSWRRYAFVGVCTGSYEYLWTVKIHLPMETLWYPMS